MSSCQCSGRVIALTALGVTAVAFLVSRCFRGGAPPKGADSTGRCYALVFVKPHGHPADVSKEGQIVPYLENHLKEAGIAVEQKGVVTGPTILDTGMIDRHYAAIAAYALRTAPKDLPVSDAVKEEFRTKYGLSWADAASKGLIMGCGDAMRKLGQSEEAFLKTVDAARPTGMKLAPGCYISKLADGAAFIYVVNGFYAGMRSEYIKPTTRVTWYEVSWPEAKLSWKSFRADVLGATDPTRANNSSVRRQILIRAPELGLSFVPSTGNNCVHGSASGLEGLNERRIWAGVTDVGKDPFGRWLLETCKFSAADVDWFLSNPTVNGKPLYDVVEDASSEDMEKGLRAALATRR